MLTSADAAAALNRAWPFFVNEARSVLGSELHYQAMLYHCLRAHGAVPVRQLGMNVKQYIKVGEPTSELFRTLNERRKPDYRGGVEPTPDVVLFAPDVNGDWRRRSYERTLVTMLMAIEVKVSERHKVRLGSGEVIKDIAKLAAHREEVKRLGGDMQPIMLVVDTAPDLAERMTGNSYRRAVAAADALGVSFLYVSQTQAIMIPRGADVPQGS